jgi:hypothetical protein
VAEIGITHRSIMDRLAELGRAEAAAREVAAAPFKKERDSLQEACGGVGHLWSAPDAFSFGLKRVCVVCRAKEIDSSHIDFARRQIEALEAAVTSQSAADIAALTGINRAMP